MIPLQLTIEGLYSYQKSQTIDFTSLTESGLFGIFGAVGSGKSSILEAITFALFAETERMNAKEKRAYNMMNLRSGRSFVAFDFENHEGKIFRATREYKRNSKNFEDVKNKNTVFYKKSGDEWIPLPHTNAEKIIGLSYENFKRTIIIPQGQFKEFLELGPTDRTKMMKEIFGLERFDLQQKVNEMRGVSKTKLDQLEGKLSGYENVSSETLASKTTIFEKAKTELKLKQQAHELLEKKYQEFVQKREEFVIYQSNKKKLEQLSVEEKNIEEKKKSVEKFEKTKQHFAHLFEAQQEIEKEENNLLTQQKNIHKLIEKIKEEQKLKHQKLAQIEKDFNQLDQLKNTAKDWQTVAQLLDIQSRIKNYEDKIPVGKNFVNDQLKAQQEAQTNIKITQENIATNKQKMLDANLLISVSNWFQQKNNLSINITKVEEKLMSKIREYESILRQIEELSIDKNQPKKSFLAKIETLESQKKSVEKQLAQVELEQKLSEFAHNLHDGEACPLCGSENHPQKNTGKDQSGKISALKEELSKADQAISQVRNDMTNAEKQVDLLHEKEKQCSEERKELDLAKTHFDQHIQTYQWSDYIADEKQLEEKQRENDVLKRQIELQEQQITELQKKAQDAQVNLDKAKERLNQYQTDLEKSKSAFDTLHDSLTQLNWQENQSNTITEAQEKANELQQKTIQTEKEHKTVEQEVNQLQIELAGQLATQKSIENQIAEMSKKHQKIKNKIEDNLQICQFESVKIVHEILATNLDIEQVKKEIDNFYTEWNILRSKVEEAQSKFENFDGSEANYLQKKQSFENSSAQLKSLTSDFGKIEGELDRLQNELKAKEKIIQEQQTLQQRFDNLSILKKMFDKQGFVEFVSTIYLRQLCENANVRFHRMTRNQLSLQINENNDFEIIDYLNEGKSRSAKTLSGGQSFQVSLSLALALAESVQSFAQSNKNFFFIDEGFGTQDQESVNIVFETLSQLQKENRIVGIISHVEELKDRIPVALQITKDEEKGSQIEII